MKPLQLDSIVLNNSTIGDRTFQLSLEGSPLAKRVVPGQFIMLRSNQAGFPILNRPFSVHDVVVNRRGEMKGIKILYKVVGEGTQLLSRLTRGDPVEIVGPLGKGYSIKGRWNSALLVAGGMGLAPFPLLLRKLLERRGLQEVFLLYGVKSPEEIVALDSFFRKKIKIKVASEEGGADFRGKVTELLRQVSHYGAYGEKRARIFACGPDPMLAEVAAIAREEGIPCQVSLEALMGCGFGVCLSCVREIRGNAGGPAYKKVCTEGPVFQGEDVVF